LILTLNNELLHKKELDVKRCSTGQ
jgi:hypothetical protein